jgi:hypothetical protein
MLRTLWNRLVRRSEAATVKRETEREHMSPAERRISEESVENIQGDLLVGEHLGGNPPDRPS